MSRVKQILQDIEIDGEKYKGVVFDGCNLSKYFKKNNEEAIMALTKFDIPENMKLGYAPDDFEVESRSRFNPKEDFIMMFESKQSAINVANWILEMYGEEFKEREVNND